MIGYCCIIFSGEPAYNKIEGAWKTDRPYAVVHRMAFNNKARGLRLFSESVDLIKELCISNHINAIRADTQDENKIMQHIFIREGFEYCGLVQFNGGPKLAYEWDKQLIVCRGDYEFGRLSRTVYQAQFQISAKPGKYKTICSSRDHGVISCYSPVRLILELPVSKLLANQGFNNHSSIDLNYPKAS